ncbi:recombinase family protein [Nocardioides sp. KC13]|uniref:Recombinase family protein n=1 Tax=Nocardioides turkmenicus TaxID=2711220 RepID=A0A6M1QS66_9ACTN|nr:recombinase family protein [Nocardioides sp. KC13]NGN92635.1 recombinase family protein [Nocardioides sp. KC13]
MNHGTASLLLRLSGKADDASTGLETQEKDLRELAARHGLDVIAVHTDNGKSGALRKRPGLLAWLDDAKSERATHLLAWKLDRVSRGGTAALATFLDVVEGVNADGEPSHKPVRFLSYKDSLDSESATWDIQVAVMGALAKSERDAIRERIHSHRAEVRSTPDRIHGGQRPAWVMKVPREGGGHTWAPDPEKAAHVLWAVDHIIDGGSILSVARGWTERGWKPKGKSWYSNGTRKILESPALYGVITNGGVRRDADGVAVRLDSLALISYPRWLELQEALSARAVRRDAPAGKRSPALLSGLLECASCGRIMYPHRPAHATARYRCRGGLLCPGPVTVTIALADDLVTRFVLALVGGLVIVPERPVIDSVDAGELAAVEDAHSDVQRRLTSGSATADDLASFNALTTRLAALRDKAAAADAAAEVQPPTDMRTIRQRYDAANTDSERRQILADGLPSRIVVKPGMQGGKVQPLSERFDLPDAGEYAAQLWRQVCEDM